MPIQFSASPKMPRTSLNGQTPNNQTPSTTSPKMPRTSLNGQTPNNQTPSVASPLVSVALSQQPAADSVQFGAIQFGTTEDVKATLPTLSVSERKAAKALGRDYMKFLQSAVCAPWTAKTIIEEAEAQGFQPWPKDGPANAKPGDKFYINNDHESLALVVIGEDDPVKSGMNIVGTHMDSPQPELKPDPLLERGGLSKLKTKLRGGMSEMTWFNRDLGIAGRVYDPVLDEKGEPVLDPETHLPQQIMRWVKSKAPIGMMTLEAIHHNRTLNKGREIKPEYDMVPVIGLQEDTPGTDALKSVGIDVKNAESAELFLFPTEKPSKVGRKGEFIAGQGHDDRSMAFSAMKGLFDSAQSGKVPTKTSVAFLFDNEEVGSLDRGGARSRWVENTIGKLVQDRHPAGTTSIADAREQALSKSVVMSGDVAHAFDPDKSQYHDRETPIKMGYGPVIKADVDGHYATTAQGIGLTKLLGQRAKIPTQVLATNQNIPCGTTIGPMIASNTNALTVDIGIPILSMHSVRELLARNDLFFTTRLFSSFFGGQAR